jgi:hypothetical protein
MPNFKKIGKKVGKLVTKKNAAYGNSFKKSEEFIKILYPDGIKPKDYENILLLLRIFDKQVRIATDKDALGESPWQDIAGYAILGLSNKK